MKFYTFLLSMMIGLCSPTMAQNNDVTLKIIETSDIHGSFFPYDFITHLPKKGSMARVSKYVNDLRKKYGDQNVYLLDNGDILQGQPISYYYNYIAKNKKNIASMVLNYLKYDAATVGNHDIETGHAVYDKWFSELDMPILGANIIDTKSCKPYVSDYCIIKKNNGVKIGVIGMITPAIPNWLKENIWSGLQFKEMVRCAKETIRKMKTKDNPDVIIGLFHSGWKGGIITKDYAEDASKDVAKQVDGFDIVFFGHDHTPHNSVETSLKGKKVVCLNPANNAQRVAVATITLSSKMKGNKKTFHIKNIEGDLVDVSTLGVDTNYINHFHKNVEEVKLWSDKVIGYLKNTIYTKDSYFGNSAFNDLILNLELKITKADIAFNAPLLFNASIKAGPVTVADMFNLYKFENQLCTIKMTGEEIHKYLEMSYDLWVNTMKTPNDHLLLLADTKSDAQRLGFKNYSFNFDSAAGINYTVDVTKPKGQKVTILKMSNGEKFEEKKWYTVAVNSYRANGGGELLTKGAGIPHEQLKKRIIWESKQDQRYYLMKEIEKAGTIAPEANNNWKFIPEEWVKPAAERDKKLLFGE
ncbi:5'-nucleotidase, C-terminal domain protein [Prevotella amnii CRIS 21A-A]|uniref:5'-nucleotidase, C-terminal domain protein n=1 Tax=Prevotella amnii CRIS 21A-A TaxID=679191 RepID=E1GWT2_9BACT|nr:bifunctional metallophosphatase/5'-nucleotidase [Prevotella amnii]EFN90880.1 5'-nucleotidase, C-terminal domain protein [Prevotella amnii CRIS 21A-A]